jgi:hypothetical protein
MNQGVEPHAAATAACQWVVALERSAAWTEKRGGVEG